MVGRMASYTVLQKSPQSLVGLLFLEIAPLDFPVPSSILIRRSVFLRIQNGMWGLGEGHLLELRNLMVPVAKVQADRPWAIFLLFPLKAVWNTTYLIVSLLKHRFRRHNLHLLPITSWLFSLWICFMSTPIWGGLERHLPLNCCQLLHVPLSHILMSDFFLSERSWLVRENLSANWKYVGNKDYNWRIVFPSTSHKSWFQCLGFLWKRIKHLSSCAH